MYVHAFTVFVFPRQVVEYLLEQKADAYVRNNKKETALDLAAQFGHVEVVREREGGRRGRCEEGGGW